MLHWLYMGGYWPFVWPSYALALVAIVLNIVLARRSYNAAKTAANNQREGPHSASRQ